MDSKKKKEFLIALCAVVVSASFQAIAFTSFSVPAQIYPSGVAGLTRLGSDILKDFANINIPYFYAYAIINIIFAVVVYKYIGKMFTILSLIQTLLVSVFSSFFPQIISLDNVMLMSIFGGLINGIAVGIALRFNASSGGFDFISIFLSNKYHKSMWNHIFAINVLIIITAGLLYGWERACYSIIFQFASTTCVKQLHKRYTHETLTIMTEHPEEVEKEVLANTRHGITELKGKGAYKHQDVAVLYTVINSYQEKEVVNSVLKADPHAFINIQNTKDIKGNYYQKPLN